MTYPAVVNPYFAWALGCVPARRVVPADHVFAIPRGVATCPKCDANLHGYAEAWERRLDRSWKAEWIKLNCETEPPINSRKFDNWMRWHYDMPYVYWLPVESRLTSWVNRRYSFDLDD